MKYDNPEIANNINICDLAVCDDIFDVMFVMAIGESNVDRQNYRLHSHTFYELHFILNGAITYKTDWGEAVYNNDSIILFKPDCLHCVKSHSDNLMKLTVGFEIIGECDLQDVPSVSCCNMKSSEQEFLNMILKNIRSEEYSEKLFKKQLTDLLYMIFDKKILTRYEIEKSDDRVYMAKRYIDDNRSMFFNCGDVAAYCHLSVKQLGRIFRKYEKLSLLEYIHKSKIEYICRLLRETDIPVREIGSMTGFSDVNYLCRFFKKNMGMTVNEYKEMCENEISCND